MKQSQSAGIERIESDSRQCGKEIRKLSNDMSNFANATYELSREKYREPHHKNCRDNLLYQYFAEIRTP